MAKTDLFDLPHLEEAFEALRRGRHLALRDGELYHAVQKHEEAFRELFERLGFTLVRHPRDFYYFRDSSNFTDTTARIAVFMFILVESLADRGEPVEETVMTRRFDLEELPHLQSDRYQAYMAEAGATSVDDMTNVVRAMERFGFARRMGESSFEFQSPIYRFLDLCMEMAREESGDKPQ
jgi:hypothetical protein